MRMADLFNVVLTLGVNEDREGTDVEGTEVQGTEGTKGNGKGFKNGDASFRSLRNLRRPSQAQISQIRS